MSFAEDVLGMRLMPWQRWLLIHALELRPDGLFRFRTVVVLVARQCGKTTLVEVKNLWKMFVLRVPLIIGTAQKLEYAEESWSKAVEIIEGTPELAAEVEHVDYTNGKKALRLTNGSRWKITTASRKGGRSLSGDDVNLDEIREHQTWDAWAAVTKTTMARPNPQIWAITNAGDDKSVVLIDLQEKGRAAATDPATADQSLGYFEWSAPEGCDPADERFWPMAAPALGYPQGVRIEALRSALSTDPEPVFRTECLCQRVPTLTPPALPWPAWVARGGLGQLDRYRPVGPVAVAVSASWPDAAWTSIGLAGERDGELLVQVVDHRRGSAWLPDRLRQLRDDHGPCAIVVDPAGPAGFLIEELESPEVGLELVKPTGREVVHGTGQFHAAVCGDEPRLRHYDQPELDAAVAEAQKRELEGAWTWARRGSEDIAPLEAVSLASWALAVYGAAVYDVASSFW